MEMTEIKRIRELSNKYAFDEVSRSVAIQYDKEIATDDLILAFIRNGDEHVFVYDNKIVNFSNGDCAGNDSITDWLEEEMWELYFDITTKDIY